MEKLQVLDCHGECQLSERFPNNEISLKCRWTGGKLIPLANRDVKLLNQHLIIGSEYVIKLNLQEKE